MRRHHMTVLLMPKPAVDVVPSQQFLMPTDVIHMTLIKNQDRIRL